MTSADSPIADELALFEAGDCPLAGFSHREHVRIGFELLNRHPFAEAAFRFARGLRTMAARGGIESLYHETITIAFLALIGERAATARDFAELETHHPDLFSKQALAAFYSKERLASPLARRTFLLPDQPCR
jgi:hypothetical protein